MSGPKFCCLTFEEITRIILINSENCKETIKHMFGIHLQENEDIIIKEKVSQGIVEISDLYGLISSLNNPTELQFIIESMYRKCFYFSILKFLICRSSKCRTKFS